MGKTAHIVAIATRSLGEMGFGISDNVGAIAHFFEEGEVWVGPRPVLEQDTDFLQPIPYILVKQGGSYLAYSRGAAGGEDRLHSKLSIGFGGHVDVADIVCDDDGVISLSLTLVNAAVRELKEELGIEIDKRELFAGRRPGLMEWTHVIQSQFTPVDQVHVGFVITIDLDRLTDTGQAFDFDYTIEDEKFSTLSELQGKRDRLESWSQLVVDSLSAKV